MVRADGIEPTTSVWKTEVLPLNYARKKHAVQKTGPQFPNPLAGVKLFL